MPSTTADETTAYLQYTSGSTRTPAGVMVSNKKPSGQFRAAHGRLLRGAGGVVPAGPHCCVVAAVLSRHGFVSGNLLADSGGRSRRAHEPGGVPAATGPVDAVAGKQSVAYFRRHRTSPTNWRHAKHQTTTWPGSIWRRVHASSTVASGYTPRRSSASLTGSPASILHPTVIRPSYGMAEATVYVATRRAGEPPEIVRLRLRETVRRPREACASGAARRWSVTALPQSPTCGSSIPRPDRVSGGNGRRDLGARRQRRHRLLAEA